METTKGSGITCPTRYTSVDGRRVGVLKTTGISLSKISLLFVFLLFSYNTKAQLIINEVSQGPTGAKEYVELLVVGTPTCTTVPCVDLRGYYIDDNNGTFATGAGVGIATGCIRFTTDALWSCVPAGTLIVFYNDADLNASIPAQDLSLSDGNCKLVIPISNCSLIEKNTTAPSTGTSVYPTTGFVSCGNWNQIGMANGGDSFQTLNASATSLFAVSWGNNNLSTVIYFAAGQGGMVCSNTNASDNNPNNQANWVSAATAGNETPGAPNSAANAAWINSMSNSCGTILPLSLSFSSAPTACGCTGSTTVTASGAIGPYTYTWSPGGTNADNIGSLCVGNYSVDVSSSNGCLISGTVSIASSVTLTAVATPTDVTCNGSADGTANVTVAGSPGPFTYTWTGTGGNNATATNLSPGNYTVNITDAGGCTASATATINEPPVLSSTITSTDITCFGASNGTATVTANGGTGSYTYSWTPSGGTNSTASGLSPNNYTVIVTDVNGCTTSASTVIAEPSILSLTVSSTSVTCNGLSNGSTSVTATGGTGVYSYTWSPTGGNSASANGLAFGNYSVAVSDVNGCTKTATVTVAQPVSITATVTSTDALCFGTNGSATVTASGGTGAYTYSWSPSGGTSSTATVPQGNYNVTVTDANSCAVTTSTIINEPTALTATVNTTDITCFGANNGTATVTANGGTGTYTYSWSPTGGTNSTANGLSQNNYTVIVTDVNGCVVTASNVVSEPSILSLTISSTSVTCNGLSNGTTSVTATGGTGAYTYTWLPAGGNSSSATGLPFGNYTATVNDANNCVATATVLVDQPTALTTTLTSTDALCFGANGSATVTASGGTGAYTYSWSPFGGTNSTAILPQGNYSVTVTDANSCSVTSSTTINQPPVLTASVGTTNITCFGASNGSATVTANGGTGAYTYLWSPSGGAGSTESGLSQNTYTATVTDGNGCTVSASNLVSEPPVISLMISSTSVICNGSSNGTASVSASGGTGAFTYTWSPAGGNSSSASALPFGNYSVTVNDANGCVATTSVLVNQPTALTVTLTSTNATCSTNNGTATANASGGTGTLNYTWTPSGGSTNSAANLGGGNYTVTVTDANNCTVSSSTTIVQPPTFTLSVSSTSVTCNAGTDGSATANISGGTAPFNYLWSPLGGTNAATGTILPAGSYTVNVSDAGSCNGTATVTITEPTIVTVSTNGQTLCSGQTATLTATGAGGNGSPYTYTWTPGNVIGSSISVNPAANTIYTVIASDSKGCNSSPDTAQVNVLPPLSIVVVSNDTTCAGQPASLSATPGGGTGNYAVTWMPTGTIGTSVNSSPLTTTIYTATVSDGCSASASATGQVTVLQNPVINFNPNPASGCAPVCVTFAAVAGTVPGNDITNFTWNFGDGGTASGLNASHCYNGSNGFSVYLLGITQRGCRDSVLKNSLITVFPQPVADFEASSFSTDVYDPTIYFHDLSTGNVTNWNWNFSPGTSNVQDPVHTFLNEGIYPVTLIVKNNSGCSDTITRDVIVKPVYTFYAPNAFTPDFDNMNDNFLPTGTAWDESTFNLWIFDRWGNQIYHTSDVNAGWNGKKHGEIVQEDVYVWKAELKDVFGTAHEYNGIISLVK